MTASGQEWKQVMDAKRVRTLSEARRDADLLEKRAILERHRELKREFYERTGTPKWGLPS